jgi:glucosamine--fructose-6-phosphate aminotransferase (isomerizing)
MCAPSLPQIPIFYATPPRQASAIIEHTKRIIYLEDDDIAAVQDGRITIHHSKHKSGQAVLTREIKTVEIELQEIMKGEFKHYMMKEIFEQPESTTNTMYSARFST